MNARLIGLAGAAGAGKDSAAEALVSCGWERRAFADSLRSFLLALDPIVDSSVEDGYEIEDGYGWEPSRVTYIRLSELISAHGWDNAKRTVPEVRELLQRCGVEAGRTVLGEDVWVNATLGDLPRHGPDVVVTDVRFPNEVAAIRERGGRVLRIVRPGVEDPASWRQHVSETALDGVTYDAVIYNDADPVDLHAAILNVAYNPCASVTGA